MHHVVHAPCTFRVPGRLTSCWDPPVLQNNSELEATWKLLQYSWHRHYQGIWQALQGYSWSPLLHPMVEALKIKQREHLLDLIGTAYSTVTLSKVTLLCGMTEADALAGGSGESNCEGEDPLHQGFHLLPPCCAACQNLGWQFDAGTKMLQVTPKVVAPVKQDGHANLQQMSSYMVHLEA